MLVPTARLSPSSAPDSAVTDNDESASFAAEVSSPSPTTPGRLRRAISNAASSTVSVATLSTPARLRMRASHISTTPVPSVPKHSNPCAGLTSTALQPDGSPRSPPPRVKGARKRSLVEVETVDLAAGCGDNGVGRGEVVAERTSESGDANTGVGAALGLQLDGAVRLEV